MGIVELQSCFNGVTTIPSKWFLVKTYGKTRAGQLLLVKLVAWICNGQAYFTITALCFSSRTASRMDPSHQPSRVLKFDGIVTRTFESSFTSSRLKPRIALSRSLTVSRPH